MENQRELHKQLTDLLLTGIDKEANNSNEAIKEKRLKSDSSLFLRQFLDKEIVCNENLIKRSYSFPIENREVLLKKLEQRKSYFKQLELIVQEWSANTKPANE